MKLKKRFPMYDGPDGQVFIMPSLTVPNQTLSLKTLIERYVRGQDVEIFQGVYSEDPDLDNLEKMTFDERLDAAREIKQAISTAQRIRASKKTSDNFPVDENGQVSIPDADSFEDQL